MKFGNGRGESMGEEGLVFLFLVMMRGNFEGTRDRVTEG